MKTTTRNIGRRLGTLGLALLLALAFAGDRGRAATVPAAVYGQDPLEILELKVRPNVVLVLDSSGSMVWTTGQDTSPRRGDHPRSKMFQAKSVLNQVIADNQDKVNFMMSQYYQVGSGFDDQFRPPPSPNPWGTPYDPRYARACDRDDNTSYSCKDAGARRFQYTATAAAPILKASGDTQNRGFQSWQDIRATWNRIHYRESTGGVSAVCYGDVPAQFYQTGAALATALKAAMDGATCSPSRATPRNVYTVTYDTNSGVFTFSANGARFFEMLWNTGTNSIRRALGVTWGDTGSNGGPFSSGSPYTLLSTGTWPAGFGAMQMTTSFADGTPSVTYHQVGAARLWNGETLKVQSDGTICDLVPATTLSSPAEFFVQPVNANCGTNVGAPVPYTFAGAPMTGNSDFCRGFENKVDLVPCDLGDTPSQVSLIGKYLDLEFPFKSDGTPEFYSEDTVTGTWAGQTWPAADDAATTTVDESQGGIRAAGGTPMANSLIDIKVWFDNIWTNGQTGAVARAGGPPWRITPIKDHVAPKEKTIVILVTDGNDTCESRTGTGSGEAAYKGLRTAHKAQLLYEGIGANPDAASRVQTYVIGYGVDSDKMNWIAWGGSGLRAGASDPGLSGAGEATRWTASDESSDTAITNALQSARTACKTCRDAFIAPDSDTLAAQLQGIINQGAQEGEFIAGRSITESVFEYSDLASSDPLNPMWSVEPTGDPIGSTGRYAGIVPTRFVSSFSLPGFNGQVRAYQNDGLENSVLRWSAGEKLLWLVRYGTSNPKLNTATPPAPPTDGSACQGGTCSCAANNSRGILAEECTFGNLAGTPQGTAAADEVSALASAKVKRRVYTTVGNGVYPASTNGLAQALVNGAANKRVRLWPPQSGLLPTDYTSAADLPGGPTGSLDLALGLPVPSTGTAQINLVVSNLARRLAAPPNPAGGRVRTSTPHGVALGDTCVVSFVNAPYTYWNNTTANPTWTVTRVNSTTEFFLNGPTGASNQTVNPLSGTVRCTIVTPPPGVATDLAKLQTDYKACKGSNLPAACTDTANVLGQLQAARRESRDIILAYMAGAAPVPSGEGWKRTSDTQELLFKAKTWVLADSISTAAVSAYPVGARPSVYTDQYQKYKLGVGLDDNKGIAQSKAGFGLRTPDSLVANPTTKLDLKPIMTVVFVPSNDMLHAFRAGPTFSPSSTSANNRSCPVPVASAAPAANCEYGGEELWGFVPYDQLLGLGLRTQTEAAGTEASSRDEHVYMMAGSIRFSDVFVPGSVSFEGYQSTVGVWRRVMFVGRGIGGKYLTALDITGTGPYTLKAAATGGPIPLWSRGNPDVEYGSLGGTDNNTGATTDKTAYAKMGETWSLPVVAYVNRGAAGGGIYQTARRPSPNGPEFVLFVGSGYGEDSGCATNSTPCEGRTFYTLDALSGDVIAAADVGARAGVSYSNSIVANPAGFNPKTYQPIASVHPAVNILTRVYVGDTHGRLWKFLTADPTTAIPFADLGASQPIGVPTALIGIGNDPDHPDDNVVPHVYATSGADRRVEGPFKIYGFRDDGTDSNTATTGTTTASDGLTRTYTPAVNVFVRDFDQGDPEANCGYTTEAVFRGTVQPAATFECAEIVDGECRGRKPRTFFGGTRLSLPNTKYAPPTPLACGLAGEYPCRSQFDSVLYALIGTTGAEAYDLNSTGPDAYRILRDSRLSAVSMFADPDTARGGSRLNPDEGRLKGIPKPPPPPGVPATGTTATASVVMKREPGQPSPAVRYGSTVCQ